MIVVWARGSKIFGMLLTEDFLVGSWEIVRNVEMNEGCAELEVGNSREC